MNLESAIIGAILIAICVVPIILMSQNRKKREKEILRKLSDIANQQDCKISKYEICGNFIIGIDEIKNFVFFFRQKKGKVISQFVNLSKIKNCEPVKNTRTIKNKNGDVFITDKVELIWIPVHKNEAEISFELYDEENTQLSGELQLVDEWSKQINDRLTHKK